MAKRASLIDFTARKPGGGPLSPAAEDEPERRPVGRPKTVPDGRRGTILRLSRDALKQLKHLATEEETTSHALLIEALNDLFVKRGKPPIA